MHYVQSHVSFRVFCEVQLLCNRFLSWFGVIKSSSSHHFPICIVYTVVKCEAILPVACSLSYLSGDKVTPLTASIL